MDKIQKKVSQFHRAMNIKNNEFPLIPDKMLFNLYLGKIYEEYTELLWADEEDNPIVQVADAIGDMIYVLYGLANICGIDMEPVLNEIHSSNMTKTPGEKVGEVVKTGQEFRPANIKDIIHLQVIRNKPPKESNFGIKLGEFLKKRKEGDE